MDPQQRLLLEVVWEAFEDAGIPPSSLTGNHVGVYVGASMVDYQSGASHDPAVMESHFMTGNSLSILSNRISYIFNLQARVSRLIRLARPRLWRWTGPLRPCVRAKSTRPWWRRESLPVACAFHRLLSGAHALSDRTFSSVLGGWRWLCALRSAVVVLILRKGDLASLEGNRLRGEIVDVAVNRMDARVAFRSLRWKVSAACLIASMIG